MHIWYFLGENTYVFIYLLTINQLKLHCNYYCYHRNSSTGWHIGRGHYPQFTSIKISTERMIYFLNTLSSTGEVLKWKEKKWIHPNSIDISLKRNKRPLARDIKYTKPLWLTREIQIADSLEEINRSDYKKIYIVAILVSKESHIKTEKYDKSILCHKWHI